ncbi:hypothetical protein [Bacillus sp. NPDC077027]|uniref:hypothetical protein n=1 Tax=Bacillus sp. NPDC077027 TaxID=3390548 RepID=UPI003D000D9E
MRKKNYITKLQLAIVLSIALVITASLVFTKIYFNNKEMQFLVESCYQVDGSPQLEIGSLSLDYSFECKAQ